MIPLVSDPESLSTPSLPSSDETDASFDALADPRRRAVLRALEGTERPVSLDELADRVSLAERSDERDPIAEWGDALLGSQRRVLISLRHVHVPKLADVGAVDFDADANTVAMRDPGAELLARLDPIEGTGDDTSRPESVTGDSVR
ncbi:helix-turn-helix domain-containing protein [Halosolutus amylolyticus]|uniref:Helix-turn-helix domain-containing protein n=1 Tax=Halosolutus amylolyticus TaxID=2932267 RepID=A0ABD5PND5_9EURY|nr:helix-turn-helix domain-containing protein [Halosolutus amylolyticus]